MSNNFNGLALVIKTLRGNVDAKASMLSIELFSAYKHRTSSSGQRTPFIRAYEASDNWKDAQGLAVIGLLDFWSDKANRAHASKSIPSNEELDVIESEIGESVQVAFKALAAEAEAKKVENKAKREKAKAEAEAEKAKAEAEEALFELDSGKDLLVAQSALEIAQGRIATLEAELLAAQGRIATLEAELLAAQTKPSRKVRLAA